MSALDPKAVLRKIELWFFRDMSDEQRLKLFSLFGYPVDEIGHVHGHQRKCLDRVLAALTSPAPVIPYNTSRWVKDGKLVDRHGSPAPAGRGVEGWQPTLTREQLDKLGYAIVPKEPTDAMLKAAANLKSPCVKYRSIYRAMLAAATAVVAAATHRHKKRGSEYVLLGIGRMQSEMWEERGEGTIDLPAPLQSVDMREVAIYRSVDDGSLWARPREEFEDGRFEALPAAPIPEGE